MLLDLEAFHRLLPILLVLLALSLTASTCASPSPGPRADSAATFDFETPVASVELITDLREISGLTLLDSLHLGAVQDERGTHYHIALATGEARAAERFHGRGDFEGIELTPEGLFALQSDGDLFAFAPGGDDAEKYETALSAASDTEGLAYDPVHHRLLIACKEDPGVDIDNVRAIYAFDLATRTLAPQPVLLLDARHDPSLRSFKPAALAYHPPTAWWMLVSSTTREVVALDASSTVRGRWALPARLLPQPEGLAVLPGGDLIIASEGGPARLARFRYRPGS